MDITVDGLRIHYIDTGVKPGGKTVLLLHGWGVDGSVYHLITDHLSPRHRMIVPDLPGFGQSEEPPEAWDVNRYVRFVCNFCAALELSSLVVMGHSNGGRILLDLLSRTPVPLAVEKAILLDSAGIPARHSFRYYARVYTFKTIKKLFSLPPLRMLFPHTVEHARRRFGSSDYSKASPVMQRSMVLALSVDMTPRLGAIRVPVLLLWGENDTATPLSDGKRMAAAIPDAGLVTFPGGHYAFAEHFDRCARVLDSFI